METLMQIILPSAILPLLVSFLLWRFSLKNSFLLWSLPLIWLPSYFWLIGWPSLVPAEASHWLWLLLIASMIINLIFESRLLLITVLQTTLLSFILIGVSWPVFQYQIDLKLIIEMLVIIVVAYIIFNGTVKNNVSTPALLLAICFAGMGLVIVLGGSLLIGQLAGAMASVLAVFACWEMISKQQPLINALKLVPVVQLYLVILVIARIFVEIPLATFILLSLAPLANLITTIRYALILSITSVIAAISWLLLSVDVTSYY